MIKTLLPCTSLSRSGCLCTALNSSGNAEKRIIHLGSSPIASSGSAYSVLKNLPGIIINSDGSVFMNGKSGVKVLIDGKSSYLEGTELVNYLMSLPASSLDKVELVTRPSAKYEASGNAGIIDICTKRNSQTGLSLNFQGNYEQGKYGRTNDNLSFGYRRNKLNLSGMYGYYRGRDFNDLTISRNYPRNRNRAGAGIRSGFVPSAFRLLALY